MVQKEIRRKDREISLANSVKLLTDAEYGVLSTVDAIGQPYGLPLNFVYKDNCIYFHCATVGHKLDNLNLNSKVSFCVVGQTKILPEEFATEYESAIIFGEALEVFDEEKYNALVYLVEKYSADFIKEGKQLIEAQDEQVRVIKISVKQITGKTRK